MEAVVLARIAFVAACVLALLLLQIVPFGDVLLVSGIVLAAALLVVDFPRAWRTIRHR